MPNKIVGDQRNVSKLNMLSSFLQLSLNDGLPYALK